jgi:hypothetical protein
MARSSSSRKKHDKLALRITIACAIAGFVGAFLVHVVALRTLGSGLPADSPLFARAWMFGSLIAVVAGGAVGVVAWTQAGAIAMRIEDLRLAVTKMGRTGSEVRVRVSGNDEVAALGREVQYLSSDLEAMAAERARGGGLLATEDAGVRELRDKSLADAPDELVGYETEATLANGGRGGVDYVGCVGRDDGAAGVLFTVGIETPDTIGVFAARLAFDEITRALKAGANARKALAHTNRVLFRTLPKGACARASLLEVGGEDGEAKLYQAGYRVPLWICSGGEVLEVEAEGLALGLDEGPVFERGLRSEKIPMPVGTRVVQTNDAGVRMQELLDLVREHSPKHTAGFVNLVLGTLEENADGGLREDLVLVTAKRA